MQLLKSVWEDYRHFRGKRGAERLLPYDRGPPPD